MTRYLLDTNVISEATRKVPSPQLMNWLGERDDAELFISVLTTAELWRGILQSPEGHRCRRLELWFTGLEGPLQSFAGRILPFDEPAALLWARLMAEGSKAGRPRSALDMMIAAIAEASECIVVTYNERHSQGALEILNPLRM